MEREELEEVIEYFIPRLKEVEQDYKYHPEGHVLNHSLQAFYAAYRETFDKSLIIATLFHDIGKYSDSHEHAKIGGDWLCQVFNPKVIWLIKNHMRIFTFLDGSMVKRGKAIELYDHEWFPELVLLSRFDKLARNPNVQKRYDVNDLVDKILGGV
jgi:HD superfamily phosphodiesterase